MKLSKGYCMKKLLTLLLPRKWFYDHQIKRINKSIAKDKKKAKTKEEKDEVLESYRFDYFWAIDEREAHQSNRLMKKARKYRIPFPRVPYGESSDSDGYWEGSHITDMAILTDKGHAQLNKLIREEKKGRAEIRLMYLPLVTSLAAVFGVAAAVIALMKDIIMVWINSGG